MSLFPAVMRQVTSVECSKRSSLAIRLLVLCLLACLAVRHAASQQDCDFSNHSSCLDWHYDHNFKLDQSVPASGESLSSEVTSNDCTTRMPAATGGSLRFTGWDMEGKAHETVLAKLSSPFLETRHLRDECVLQVMYRMENMRGADVVVVMVAKDRLSSEIKRIPGSEKT